jgi:hypothetical protein
MRLSRAEARHALRITFSFTLAFVVAEAYDVELSFLAPLMAGPLAALAHMPVVLVLVLPPLLWLMGTAAGFALQAFHGMPLVLCVVALSVFYAGFRASTQPKIAPVVFLLICMFAIIPNSLIKAPELVEDVARWFAAIGLIATGSVALMGFLLPGAAPGATRGPRVPPITPFAAAVALLVAVILTASMRPSAAGAVLISVIVALRADAEPPGHVVFNRLAAAVLGGAAAVIAWEVIWLAPSLPVLAGITALLAWLFAARMVTDSPWRGVAAKGLNVLAILLGEGFSVVFEDTADRVWVRIVAVMIGIAYAAIALSLAAPGPRAPVQAAATRP